MAVTVTMYGKFLESLVEGRVDVIADEMWCMIVTSAYTFNQHSHKFKSVVTGEIIGSGYVAGGKKVTGLTPIYDSGTSMLKLPAGNLNWPSVTWTGAVGAILYMAPSGVADSAKPLIARINFGASIDKSSEAFYINWPTTGVIKLDVP